MAEEFNKDQFESIYPDGIENHYWNNARNHVIYQSLKKAGLTGEQILEIGAGRGVVTKFLHDKGIAITGVELAEARPVKGAEDYFLAGTDAFELSQQIRENISVILLLDVLEHIEDPLVFMDKIVSDFPNLKHILVTLPARQELWTNYDVYNGHYKRYALRDMAAFRTGKISGFSAAYYFHLLYPVIYFHSKCFTKRQTAFKSPGGFMIIIHRLLSFLLQLDFLLLPGKLMGSSIIALFRISNDKRA